MSGIQYMTWELWLQKDRDNKVESDGKSVLVLHSLPQEQSGKGLIFCQLLWSSVDTMAIHPSSDFPSAISGYENGNLPFKVEWSLSQCSRSWRYVQNSGFHPQHDGDVKTEMISQDSTFGVTDIPTMERAWVWLGYSLCKKAEGYKMKS